MFGPRMKSCCLFAGVLLFCLSQEVNWVYGESNSAYTEVRWREPNIKPSEENNFEFAIGANFKVKIGSSSDAKDKDIQVRIFRGDREELSRRTPSQNEDCVTFPSVVFNIESINGHIRWGHIGPTWLAYQKNGGIEELSKEKFFVRFEFKNNIHQGYLKLHKKAIQQYFARESAGLTVTVVPRFENKMPSKKEKNKWLSEIREWLKSSKSQRTPSDCMQFIRSQNEESIEVAKTFKCHEPKT